MNKVHKVKTVKKKGIWFVTAYIKDLPYQERFKHKPTNDDIKNACGSFEYNYSNLNESTNKPVIVKSHHSDS